ncbi:MAG: thioredoxin family protein, partial [Endozoicomonas sp.]
DVTRYPEDAMPKMQEKKAEAGYPFPYLYDELQEVAKAFQAACTPDFFLFDGELQCVYRGRFDDSHPGNDKPITLVRI